MWSTRTSDGTKIWRYVGCHVTTAGVASEADLRICIKAPTQLGAAETKPPHISESFIKIWSKIIQQPFQQSGILWIQSINKQHKYAVAKQTAPPPPPPPLFLIQLHIKQRACFRLTDEKFVLHTEVSMVRVRKDKSIDVWNSAAVLSTLKI